MSHSLPLDKGGMYDFTNPAKVGPGAWFFMHLMAMHANGNTEKEMWVTDQIQLLCDYFKCGQCQEHCIKYLASYPPKKVVGVPYGLFYWTVEFRNSVNRRLGKPTYDPQTMFDIFSVSDYMVCTENCTGSHSSTAEAKYVGVTADPSKMGLLAKKFPGIIEVNTQPQAELKLGSGFRRVR